MIRRILLAATILATTLGMAVWSPAGPAAAGEEEGQVRKGQDITSSSRSSASSRSGRGAPVLPSERRAPAPVVYEYERPAWERAYEAQLEDEAEDARKARAASGRYSTKGGSCIMAADGTVIYAPGGRDCGQNKAAPPAAPSRAPIAEPAPVTVTPVSRTLRQR